MRNRMYGGVRGRKTKVGSKLFRFPPTRFPVWTSLGLNQGPPDYESLPYSLIGLSISACYTSLCNLAVNYRSTFLRITSQR